MAGPESAPSNQPNGSPEFVLYTGYDPRDQMPFEGALGGPTVSEDMFNAQQVNAGRAGMASGSVAPERFEMQSGIPGYVDVELRRDRARAQLGEVTTLIDQTSQGVWGRSAASNRTNLQQNRTDLAHLDSQIKHRDKLTKEIERLDIVAGDRTFERERARVAKHESDSENSRAEYLRTANYAAEARIFGSHGKKVQVTNPNTGHAELAVVPGLIDRMRTDTAFGHKAADREKQADAYQDGILKLVDDGLELCQAEIVMSARHKDKSSRASMYNRVYASLVQSGVDASEAMGQANEKVDTFFNKRDAQRMALIRKNKIYTAQEYGAYLQRKNVNNKGQWRNGANPTGEGSTPTRPDGGPSRSPDRTVQAERELSDALTEARDRYAELTAKERKGFLNRLLKVDGAVAGVLGKVPGVKKAVKGIQDYVQKRDQNREDYKQLMAAKNEYESVKGMYGTFSRRRLNAEITARGIDPSSQEALQMIRWREKYYQAFDNAQFEEKVRELRDQNSPASRFSNWYARQKGFKGGLKKAAVFVGGGAVVGGLFGGAAGIVGGSILAAKGVGLLAGGTYGTSVARHINKRRATTDYDRGTKSKDDITWQDTYDMDLSHDDYAQTITGLTEKDTDRSLNSWRGTWRYAGSAALAGMAAGNAIASNMHVGGSEGGGSESGGSEGGSGDAPTSPKSKEIEIDSPSNPIHDPASGAGANPSGGEISPDQSAVPTDVESGSGIIRETNQLGIGDGGVATQAYAHAVDKVGIENVFQSGTDNLFPMDGTVLGQPNMGISNPGAEVFTPEYINAVNEYLASIGRPTVG